MSANDQRTSRYHHHFLKSTIRKCYCDICYKKLPRNTPHFYCDECDFDICPECIDIKDNYNFNPMQAILQSSLVHIQESNEIISLFNQQKVVNFNMSFITYAISCSREKFFLFEEQSHFPDKHNYEIEATRKYIDTNGNVILYFSSSQARKMIATCSMCIERFVNDHKATLVVNESYPLLREIIYEEDLSVLNIVELYSRSFASGLTKGASLGIVSIIQYFAFDPPFQNALGAAYFKKCLKTAAKNSQLCCVTNVTRDMHIKPYNDISFTSLLPDHNLTIDWGTLNSLPIIISLLNEIKQSYINCKMSNDFLKLNMMFGAVDYMEEGLNLMLRNPIFSNINQKKLISFTLYSVQAVQIFFRIEPKTLTILSTVIPNVFQTDKSGDKRSHAFLSFDDLIVINSHLIVDIREALTRIAGGKLTELNLQKPEETIQFLEPFIKDAEFRMLQFFQQATNRLIQIGEKTILPMLQSNLQEIMNLIGNHFIFSNKDSENSKLAQNNQNNQLVQNAQNNQIEQNVQNNQMVQNAQNNQIEQNVQNNPIEQNSQNNQSAQDNANNRVSQFNESFHPIMKDLIEKNIKKHLLPDFYNAQIGDLKSEIANLKHLKELVLLACEIERRKNDNISILHIDLIIEECDDCIQKYYIQAIL